MWVSAQVYNCGDRATVVEIEERSANGNQAEDRYVLRFPHGQTFTGRRAYIRKFIDPHGKNGVADKWAAATAGKERQVGAGGIPSKSRAASAEANNSHDSDQQDQAFIATKGEVVLTFRNTEAVADLSKSEVDDALIRTGETAHITASAGIASTVEMKLGPIIYVVEFADGTTVRRQSFHLLKLSEMIARESVQMKDECGLSTKAIFATYLAEEMKRATEKVRTQMHHAEEQARQEVAEKVKRAEMKARAEADRWLKETRDASEKRVFDLAKKTASSNAVEEIRRIAIERLDTEAEENVQFDEDSGFPVNEAARKYCVRAWTGEADLKAEADLKGIGYLGTFCVDYAVLQQVTDGFAEEHLLGRGGSCRVFKGRVYGHLVAIKVFNEDGGSWDDKQIQAEIKLLCSVRHPHINKLLAVSFNGDHRCLVLEYMDGGSLDTRIFAKPLLQWKERAAVLLHTARGLAHLHSLNPPIIHRDVKSANGESSPQIVS
jgi:hypothetical protein